MTEDTEQGCTEWWLQTIVTGCCVGGGLGSGQSDLLEGGLWSPHLMRTTNEGQLAVLSWESGVRVTDPGLTPRGQARGWQTADRDSEPGTQPPLPKMFLIGT